MVTNFFLRPNSIPLTLISPAHFPKPFSLSKLAIVSLFSTTNATAPVQAFTPKPLPYGPSLHKGRAPSPNSQQLKQKDQNFESQSGPGLLCPSGEDPDGETKDPPGEDDDIIDEDKFTRVFDISALRVPARDCFALESRLRGHLLNWPRIPNIARVPGDEVEEELVSLLRDKRGSSDDEEAKVDAVNRRVYGKGERDGEELSPVLYRERLAKEFNARGFVKFRNLAKISRPKKKKNREEGKEGGEKRESNWRRRKGELAVVEVLEEEEVEDWKGLLGEEFKGRSRWRGSTRLLLLDERHSEKQVEELPQAVKAALQEAMKENPTSTFEIVRCKLTLFYDYWLMNEILEALLPKDILVPSSFEQVGHIAHLNLRDDHLPFKKIIAKVVLDKNKPKIQTVVNKTDAIHNDYRTMQLEVLAGNRSLVTVVVENGLRFNVDLATVYWNSRLSTERQRLLNGLSRNDVVCDVFSGVGPIALSAAKIVKRVYANDLNPYAVDYMERNIVLNKLDKKIEVFNMDGRRFINAMFASDKAQSITQVVMNLPNDAVEYLDAFSGVLRDKPNTADDTLLPMIHVYGFSKAQDPEFDFHERIRIALKEVAVDVEMHRVRHVAPGKWMLCASFRLPMSVACRNTRWSVCIQE